MIRYRQEYCVMVVMLLPIRYLSLTLTLCRLLGSLSKSVPSSKRTILIINIKVSILVTLDKVLRSVLHANSLII